MVITEIIRKYLEIILNWPFLGGILVAWFIQTFKEEIRSILKARFIKIGNTEFNQAQIEETTFLSKKTNEEHDWEFMFYERAVANSTLRSLLWLYNTSTASKSDFFDNIVYSTATIDIIGEKQAQFNILLNYGFIELDESSLLKVSPKGIKLLKYNKFIL